MKTFIITLCCCVSILPAFAFKKKEKELLRVVSSVYYNQNTKIRKVGTIYEITIQTMFENVTIDSVWFGATPVPCDLLETSKKHRVTIAKDKGTYIVKANKNLYANYPQQVDSTEAYKNFVAPFSFNADAVIMYKVNGKRYYKIVRGVKMVKAKGTR